MSTLAVVVFSGGLDSTTALAEAVKDHGTPNVMPVTFDYGQKHKVETLCAAEVCSYYGLDQTTITMDPAPFVGGSLTSASPVVNMRYDDLPEGEMSPTYVPFRNGNLIAQGAAFADSLLRAENPRYSGYWDKALLYCGMHSEDAAGFAYADCTPEFLGAMAAAIYIGTYHRVRLHALYQHRTKAEIIKRGKALGAPYSLTHSCYRGERPACGKCSTCQARLDAFSEAGFSDPLSYAAEDNYDRS